MAEQSYLQWLVSETPTTWWHDSADPVELKQGLFHKACGITTNPVLASKTINSSRAFWGDKLSSIPRNLEPERHAEAILERIVTNTAAEFESVYKETKGKAGYVCAQVNPAIAADAEAMIAMGKRFNSWAPNIAVKFPVTAAGLDALEECVADGITVAGTVSFTVPQVIAIANRHKKGITRAIKAGKKPSECFAVIMIGRVDDYFRDVANDNKANISESDIRQAGLAISKRAYSIYKEEGYPAKLLVAALRGTYHMEGLTGAELIMSIHPKYQELLLQPEVPREPNQIDVPIAPDVIKRLKTIPDFVRAYEPDGMEPNEFITFGITQRTLTQFSLAGWSQLESFSL